MLFSASGCSQAVLQSQDGAVAGQGRALHLSSCTVLPPLNNVAPVAASARPLPPPCFALGSWPRSLAGPAPEACGCPAHPLDNAQRTAVPSTACPASDAPKDLDPNLSLTTVMRNSSWGRCECGSGEERALGVTIPVAPLS